MAETVLTSSTQASGVQLFADARPALNHFIGWEFYATGAGVHTLVVGDVLSTYSVRFTHSGGTATVAFLYNAGVVQSASASLPLNAWNEVLVKLQDTASSVELKVDVAGTTVLTVDVGDEAVYDFSYDSGYFRLEATTSAGATQKVRNAFMAPILSIRDDVYVRRGIYAEKYFNVDYNDLKNKQWITNGTTIYYNGGNVGVGTATPKAKLDVFGSFNLNVGRGDVYIENNANDSADGAGITFRTSVNPTNGSMFAVRSLGQASRLWIGQGLSSFGYNAFYFGFLNVTGGESITTNYRSVLTNDGKVGIGTTTPTQALDVVGNINFTGDLYKNGVIFNPTSSQWTTNGTMIYYTAGNVGIGETNPVANLQIGTTTQTNTVSSTSYFNYAKQFALLGTYNSTVNTGNSIKLYIGNYDNDLSTNNVYLIMCEDENGQLDFFVKARATASGLPTMYFAGNVGVGTTVPTQKLHVVGDIGLTGDIYKNGVIWSPTTFNGGIITDYLDIDNNSGLFLTYTNINKSKGNIYFNTSGFTFQSRISPSPNYTLASLNASSMSLTNGLTVGGNLNLTGNFYINGLYGTTYFGVGTADNATYDLYNLKIRSWWGIGFPSYDNVNRIVIDTRNGNISTKGNINVEGNAQITGSLYFTSLYEPVYKSKFIRNLSDYSGFEVLGDIDPWNANTYDLGNGVYRWRAIYLNNSPNVSSDARLKTDICDSVLGLDFINSLRPVSYKMIDGDYIITDEATEDGGKTYIKTARPGVRTHFGLIAQEVKESVDKLGIEDFSGWSLADKNDPDSLQSLCYESFISPMIKAIQELYLEHVKVLEAKNQALENRFALLEPRLTALEQRLATI